MHDEVSKTEWKLPAFLRRANKKKKKKDRKKESYILILVDYLSWRKGILIKTGLFILIIKLSTNPFLLQEAITRVCHVFESDPPYH